jgi:hypothetical protein
MKTIIALLLMTSTALASPIICASYGPEPAIEDKDLTLKVIFWADAALRQIEPKLGKDGAPYSTLYLPGDVESCQRLNSHIGDWVAEVEKNSLDYFFRNGLSYAIGAHCEQLQSEKDPTHLYWVKVLTARAAACLSVFNSSFHAPGAKPSQ